MCGNFEEGHGHDPYNRSGVSSAYELKTVLALAEESQWDIGAPDIKTTFLYAELDEEVDPIYLVTTYHCDKAGAGSARVLVEVGQGPVWFEKWTKKMG